MNKKGIFINKKRRKEIKSAVISTLEKTDKLTMPVNIKYITKRFSNIRLIPYSLHMKVYNLSYKEMLTFAGSNDAFTDYDANKRKYIIYYNDCDKSIMYSNRYRWNIAYELGHVALAHPIKHPEARLFRNSLSEHDYNLCEAEADYFAALILVPHSVLNSYKKRTISKSDIMDRCKISNAASSIRFYEFQKWLRSSNHYTNYDKKIYELFSPYMYKKSCSDCGNVFIYKDSKYCCYCDRQNLKWEDDGTMIYDKFLHNKCDVCGNEEITIEDSYCKICGEDLRNYCENESCPSCINKIPLPSNARFCPMCGEKSRYYNKGLLSSWDTYKNQIDYDDLPLEMFYPIDETITDDDLPF